MSVLFLTLLTFADIKEVNIGLASVFNDAKLACPASSYKKTKLPVCAHRELPCGTILNVQRYDNNQIAQCVVGDRGPYGACKPSNKNTRACGPGARWINGRDFVRKKKPMNTTTWRGILDMKPQMAKRLGVKNRLVRVIVYTNIANNQLSHIFLNEDEDSLK